MNFHCVAQFPADQNLFPLTQALHQANIGHRITEDRGQQQLWVAESAPWEKVQLLIQNPDLLSGQTPALESPINSANCTNSIWAPSAIKAFILRTPFTLLLILFGVLGYAIYVLAWYGAFSQLTFVPTVIRGEFIYQKAFSWAEPWRIITPIFIHFSLVHILFNGAAMLQLGTWLERIWGGGFYLFLCLFTGIAGNVLQYIWEGDAFFGGLSSVVFGLFAFNGVTQWLRPDKAFRLPKGAYIWMLIWLVAGFTPLMEQLFNVQMGNGAHLGGALAGVFLAFVKNFRGRYVNQ